MSVYKPAITPIGQSTCAYKCKLREDLHVLHCVFLTDKCTDLDLFLHDLFKEGRHITLEQSSFAEVIIRDHVSWSSEYTRTYIHVSWSSEYTRTYIHTTYMYTCTCIKPSGAICRLFLQMTDRNSCTGLHIQFLACHMINFDRSCNIKSCGAKT